MRLPRLVLAVPSWPDVAHSFFDDALLFQQLYDNGRYASRVFLMHRMRVISVGLILFAESAWRNTARAADGLLTKQHGDYAVLIHGLGRTSRSMKRLQWALARE